MKTQWGECRLVTLRETPPDYMADTPDGIAEYYRQAIASGQDFRPDQEGFWTIMLNTRLRVLGHTLVSFGIVDQVLVHTREVFRAAIVGGAHAVVLIHNHPSGDPTPSDADVGTTRQLVQAGKLLKIEVLDHLIMASDAPWEDAREMVGPAPDPTKPPTTRRRRWYSLRALGYIG